MYDYTLSIVAKGSVEAESLADAIVKVERITNQATNVHVADYNAMTRREADSDEDELNLRPVSIAHSPLRAQT
jgi:hypothetical protein